MRQDTKYEIKNALLKNKNLAMILYVLSQIPSYTEELAGELRLSKSTVEKAIHYLRTKKLIKFLGLNSSRNDNFYPLLLKKLKNIRSQSRPDKAKSVKFYFVSRRGANLLPFIKEILFKKGDKK